LFSQYCSLSRANCKTRDIIVLSRTCCSRAIVLSRALIVSLAILSLSLAHASSSQYRSLFRTRYRSLSHALFSRYRSLSFICPSLSLTYLCVVLLPPMRHLTMHRPCTTLTPSLSHVDAILVALSSSHTLSAILFPQPALSFSHLSTILFPRIPLLLADLLVHRSRRDSPFPTRTPSSIGRAADPPFPRENPRPSVAPRIPLPRV